MKLRFHSFKPVRIFAALVSSLALGFLLGCPASPPRADGGSSEETNAIAGVVVDGSGTPVAGAKIEVRPSNVVPVSAALAKQTVGGDGALLTTTDSKGKWFVNPSLEDEYRVLANGGGGQLSIHTVDYKNGPAVKILDTLRPSVSLQSVVLCRGGLPQGLVAMLPGTPWFSMPDSAGRVRFDSLPQGDFELKIRANGSQRIGDVDYRVAVTAGGVQAWGPFSAGVQVDSTSGSRIDTIRMPFLNDFGVRATWSFSYLGGTSSPRSFVDSRGRAGQGTLFGGSLVSGLFGNALALGSGNDFGVVEDPGSVFDSLREFSVEAWVRVRTLPALDTYQLNLFGKLGFAGSGSNDLFSLAVVRPLGDSASHFAYLLSDGQSGELDSADLVMAPQPVALEQWAYLMATWDGVQSCIYVNGRKGACRVLPFSWVLPGPEALYFGKEDYSVELDEIQVSDVKLEEADAQYRWLRRFQ